MPQGERKTLMGHVFGKIVKRLRTERGWTLIELAKRSGMNPTYLGVLEKGGNAPTLHRVLYLADVFQVDPLEIVREIDEARRAYLAEQQAVKMVAKTKEPEPPAQ